MEAIVLAGGFGTRLRDVVSDVPKPMAPIGDKPFLHILLSRLAQKGFKHVILAIGYLAEKITNYFGDNFKGMDISYVVEDDPLGTGGAVRLAMTKAKSDYVFVLNGDTFLDADFASLDKLWKEHSQPIMVARKVPDIARYGALVVQDNRLSGYIEKGEEGPGVINAGCYVLPVKALDMYEIGKNFSIESDYFQKIYETLFVRVSPTDGHFIDIGIPEDFERAQTELAIYS